jgi:hypothetical protein
MTVAFGEREGVKMFTYVMLKGEENVVCGTYFIVHHLYSLSIHNTPPSLKLCSKRQPYGNMYY